LFSAPIGGECWKGRDLGCIRNIQKLWVRKGCERKKGASMNIWDPADREKNPSLAGQKASAVQASALQAEDKDEARRIRRLQVMMSMVTSVISQDPGLTVEEASELAAGAKRAALAMFPDKELAYDLLYKPRLQRLMRERFRLQ
jgi:hypothetical protein